MMRRLMLIALATFTFFVGASCSERRAEELFDTARLEERQNNPNHARQLYLELLKKYPDSAVAAEAQKRLQALSGNPGDQP
ncbi:MULTISPECIES: tetratricopeptide repeat protein [Desulfococcus]|uniref:Tetratricopeptide repeat protein n=1 Tax=Desulfococcus multivorans DSM 2059 TaxID=1121405 RepID=S7U2T0_DESML|nr:hypothetical protein [Desulfococcus multivorans]AQV02949.2 hypothetical protein B2D07_08530 [Desulfococcus multivorans]EPR43280.1 hypothetical protein dsmv_1306 [Desulfococcus multivorans DSM 2059]MDX9817327.1 hypothetical protein [Desulfococcus multivorans]SJZ41971.1 hypothetical protein SAMN02745446_00422 [Desulfococcus multivorans DSM 2059]